MFDCYENVVYPGHGVARISRIVEKRVAGVLTTFYELTFLSKDVTVLVPTVNAHLVGLRRLSSTECVDEVFQLLAKPAQLVAYSEFPVTSWNKRNKGYQLKLRTGSLYELSEIYHDLKLIEKSKPLSFGEKNLLAQAEALLAEEISLIRNIDQRMVLEKLRTLYYGSTPPCPQ
jgi:CarD family transcriptional regulator